MVQVSIWVSATRHSMFSRKKLLFSVINFVRRKTLIESTALLLQRVIKHLGRFISDVTYILKAFAYSIIQKLCARINTAAFKCLKDVKNAELIL